MAKAKLYNGHVLEFDDSLSDEEIDKGVADYMSSTAELKKMNKILEELKTVMEASSLATIAALKNNVEMTVDAITAPRETSIISGVDGKPSKSVTTVRSTIFDED